MKQVPVLISNYSVLEVAANFLAGKNKYDVDAEPLPNLAFVIG
jgi:hypothetical protein